MKYVFKQALIAAGFLIGAQVALAAGGSSTAAVPAAPKGDIAAGEAKAAVCGACHGADGNSLAPNFPKLAGLGQAYLLKQLKDVKSGNRQIVEMTGLLDNLSDQDLLDLAAYFNSKTTQLSGSKDMTVKINPGIDVDAVEYGAKLYRAGKPEVGAPACTGCHSPRGLGNGPAGYPRLSGQHADYIEKQLKDFRAGLRVNDGDKKTMRQVAAHLSDSDIKALANFIAGLN